MPLDFSPLQATNASAPSPPFGLLERVTLCRCMQSLQTPFPSRIPNTRRFGCNFFALILFYHSLAAHTLYPSQSFLPSQQTIDSSLLAACPVTHSLINDKTVTL